MGCRENKLKYNCGSLKQNARCTFYEGKLPKFSELDDCITIEETTEEIYDNIQDIKDSIDLSELGTDCIDFSEYKKGKYLKISEALMAVENAFCDLKEVKESKNRFDISKIDLKCMADPCDNIVDTQEKLIQLIINTICELKNQT